MTTIATPGTISVSRNPLVPAVAEYGETFRMDENRPENSPPPASALPRSAYPSDLTEAQWSRIEPLLPERKTTGRTGRPPRYSLRELLNGILYAQRTGCAWRYLPRDLPHWTSVYAYWQKWTRDGTLVKALAALRVSGGVGSAGSPATATPLTPFPEVVTSADTPRAAASVSAEPVAERPTEQTTDPATQAPDPSRSATQLSPPARQNRRRRVVVMVRRSGSATGGPSPINHRTPVHTTIVSSHGSAEPMLLKGSKGGSGTNSGDADGSDADSSDMGSGDASVNPSFHSETLPGSVVSEPVPDSGG